jgi:hypothetical protein
MKVLLAVAAVATSMPLLAAEGPDQTASQASQPSRERLVCRRVGVVSSQSRLGRQRVCMTAAQWRARSDMSADDVEGGLSPLLRTQGRPVTEGIGGPGG